jgi:hypothetical protein
MDISLGPIGRIPPVRTVGFPVFQFLIAGILVPHGRMDPILSDRSKGNGSEIKERDQNCNGGVFQFHNLFITGYVSPLIGGLFFFFTLKAIFALHREKGPGTGGRTIFFPGSLNAFSFSSVFPIP